MNRIAYLSLWLFIFALPWQNVIVIPGVGTISRMMGIVAFALVIVVAVLSGRLRRWRAFHVSALVFVLWAGWSLYWGNAQRFHDYEVMYVKLKTYIQLFLVLWMIWELATTRSRQRGLLVAYVLGAGVAAINTLLVFRTGAGTMRRFAAQGFDPNDLAMMLALALPMAWYIAVTSERPIVRWLCRAYVPLGIMASLLTGSRGGLIASIVALAIVPLTMLRLSPARVIAAIVLLGGAGTLGALYVPDVVVKRLQTTGTEISDGGNGRLRIWTAGAKALMQRPVFGWGTGGFQRAVRPILGTERVAHNSFLGVAVEQGVLGFLLYMTMFVAVFRRSLGMPLLERRFALVLMATLGIAMLPLTWDDAKPVWFILGVLIAMAESMQQTTAEPSAELRQASRPPRHPTGRPAPAWTKAGFAFPPR